MGTMAAAATRLAAVAMFTSMLFASSNACVYLYGSRNESAAQAGGHWSYGFSGLDWVDGFEQCGGEKQSPLLLSSSLPSTNLLQVSPDLVSRFSYGTLTSNGSNITVANNGHTIQVSWPTSYTPDVSIAVAGDVKDALPSSLLYAPSNSSSITRVPARPAQLHFHTRSEHVIDGKFYPLEMHIVHLVDNSSLPKCGTGLCATVLGVLFELADNVTDTAASAALDLIFSKMPMEEKSQASLGAGVRFNLDALLPSDRSYITYEGSLTTPPCTEGILWHVLTTPMQMTVKQLDTYLQAVGDTYCPSNDVQRRRRLLAAASNSSHTTSSFALPPKFSDGCYKLGNGHNYREVQEPYGRVVMAYPDPNAPPPAPDALAAAPVKCAASAARAALPITSATLLAALLAALGAMAGLGRA